MIARDCVFEGKRFWAPYGSVPPADLLPDVSRYGRDGAFVGAGEPAWVQLPSGLWVLDFDATDDYILHGTILFAANAPWTHESWLLWDGDPGGDYIGYAGMDGGNRNLMLKYASNNRFAFRAVDNNFYQFAAGSSTTMANVWTHVVWMADGAGNMTIFLNGVFLATIAVAGTTQMTHQLLGRCENNNRWCYGGLGALFRIYSYVLTPDQINAKYQSERHWFDGA